MHVVARARLVLARRPSLYWLGVLLLALGAAWVAAGAAAAVDGARREWGDTRTVVVATADLEPGDPLAGATDRRPRPLPLVPAAAVQAVRPGAVARQHVAAGEVLVAADVAATGSPRALIPAGWSAVAVAEAVPSGAVTGDVVTAVADGVVVAPDGVVVGRHEDAVLVAVPDAAAAAVATAATLGSLALLLRP